MITGETQPMTDIGRRRKIMGFWHKFLEFVNVLIEANKIVVFNIFPTTQPKNYKKSLACVLKDTEKYPF